MGRALPSLTTAPLGDGEADPLVGAFESIPGYSELQRVPQQWNGWFGISRKLDNLYLSIKIDKIDLSKKVDKFSWSTLPALLINWGKCGRAAASSWGSPRARSPPRSASY